nr:MAG TPA: hypothetical protein [Caudoviricetes sp.]
MDVIILESLNYLCFALESVEIYEIFLHTRLQVSKLHHNGRTLRATRSVAFPRTDIAARIVGLSCAIHIVVLSTETYTHIHKAHIVVVGKFVGPAFGSIVHNPALERVYAHSLGVPLSACSTGIVYSPKAAVNLLREDALRLGVYLELTQYVAKIPSCGVLEIKGRGLYWFWHDVLLFFIIRVFIFRHDILSVAATREVV